MIQAYAVDPALAAGWGDRREYRYFVDKFGPGTPRMLLVLRKFNKWRRQVLREARDKQLTDVEQKRLEVLLLGILQGHYRRENSAYDGNLSWLDNALQEFERCRFAGILTAAETGKQPGIIHAEDLVRVGGTSGHALLAATPKRQPDELAAALKPMLHDCREVRIVDPYFNPELKRWSVLVALTRVVGERCSGPLETGVMEIHCHDKHSGTREHFVASARQRYRTHPLACPVRVIRWQDRNDGRGERFHNRYVMTDIGGVILGGGLEKGQHSEREDINLMSGEQHSRRWRQFDEQWRRADANGPFTWRDDLLLDDSILRDA